MTLHAIRVFGGFLILTPRMVRVTANLDEATTFATLPLLKAALSQAWEGRLLAKGDLYDVVEVSIVIRRTVATLGYSQDPRGNARPRVLSPAEVEAQDGFAKTERVAFSGCRVCGCVECVCRWDNE